MGSGCGNGGTGGGSAAVEGCKSLVPGQTQLLSTQAGEGVESMATVPTGVLAGLRRFDSADNTVWSVLHLGADGAPLGDLAPLVTAHSSGSVGRIEVAAGPSSAAAIFADLDHGCWFVPLGLDGTPLAAPISTGLSWCESLLAVGPGFSFLANASAPAIQTLVTTNGAGSILANVPVAKFAGTTLRAGLPDLSFAAMWDLGSIDCFDCALTMAAQRFSPSGDAPLGSAQSLFTDAKFGFLDLNYLAFVSTAKGALAGWSSTNPEDTGFGVFHVAPFTLSASDTNGEVVIVPPNGMPLEGIALAEVKGGDVVAAWEVSDSSGESTLYARPLAPSGHPYAPPVQVVGGPAVGGQTGVKIAATSSGAVAIVQAGGFMVSAQLICVP
jgi:hypothetical protein